MRKYFASIIAAGVLCSFLLLNINLSESSEQSVPPTYRMMSLTSLGEGS